MTAKLEFSLPEEQGEFGQASNAGNAFGVLFDIDETLRKIVKYGETSELPGVNVASAEALRTWFWNELQERGIAHLLT